MKQCRDEDNREYTPHFMDQPMFAIFWHLFRAIVRVSTDFGQNFEDELNGSNFEPQNTQNPRTAWSWKIGDQTFGLYRFNRRSRDVFYHDRVRLWLLRVNNEYIMIFGTKELYIFRLLAPFERSMDRRIISLSDDPSMTSRLGLYKVTWWSGHRTLFQHVIKLRYDQFLFIIDFGDNNETLLSFLFRIIGRIIRLFTKSVVPDRTVHRHTSSTARWFRISRYSSMHPKSTN